MERHPAGAAGGSAAARYVSAQMDMALEEAAYAGGVGLYVALNADLMLYDVAMEASEGSLFSTPPRTSAGSATNTIRYGPTNPGPLDDAVVATFRSGSYSEVVLDEATTLYRVYGGEAGQLGSYWSRTAPTGPMQAQIDLALNPEWGNLATDVASIRVPAGTTIFEGAAAAQSLPAGGTLLGGGSQVYIPRVNPDWLLP